MRIFIYPGTSDCANLGDLAMLQVALERLKGLWPDAIFAVLMRKPAMFKVHCPDAVPVPMRGCKYWLERRGAPGMNQWLPHRRYYARKFAEEFLRADLLVMSGAGILTDCFQAGESRVLNTFKAALARGLPTAMLGQGIGPINNEVLRARAAEVLPRVGVLSLRESGASLCLLRQLNVPEDRIAVTGDDAIELAYRERRAVAGSSLGVNLRLASYSGIQPAIGEVVRKVLIAKARQFQTDLVGIPITVGSCNSDVQTLNALLPEASDPGPGLLVTPTGVMRRISTCRVIVAGSYHAGVFALSQGIPVVAVVHSEYYTNKFQGLAAQFGCGCTVLQAGEEQFAARLAAALDAAWLDGETVRLKLLAAAERQIAAGRAAYAKLPALVRAQN